MNKQKENERDLRRLKNFFAIVLLVLSGVIFYSGINVIQRNIPRTIDESLITSLAILGLYGIIVVLIICIINMFPKTEEEIAIKKAKDKIEAEFKLRKAQERLKKLK